MVTSSKSNFRKTVQELRRDPKPVIVAFAIFLLFAGTYVFSGDIGVLGNVIIITILAVSAPYLIITYVKYSKIREIENKFPQFLRDVSDSVKSGSSLPQAIKSVSTIDYGRLTPEVKHMANQLSWSISFEKTIRTFMKRMEKSEIITRSMTILLEAYNAGGNIGPILNSVADSVVVLKEAEYEKKSLLREHVIMMYAIFFVFIGIIMALTGILLPILTSESGGFGGLAGGSGAGFGGLSLNGGNPCEVCRNLQCTLCDTFEGIGSSMGFGEGIKAYYKALFFLMIMVQALFSGLVAGQIGEDSLKAGIKHSMIMVGAGFAIYIVAIRLGFI